MNNTNINPNTRWKVLFASTIINMCIGSAYAWSVFQKPLIKMFNWDASDVSIAFTLSLIMLPLSMIVAGRIQDKIGPKLVTMSGGIIFSIGIFSTGFINSLPMLYVTYGLLGGIGIGTVYACTIANTVTWFPDKKGLAGGLTAGGFGFGAVIVAPLAANLIANYGVLSAFKYFGVAYLVIILITSQLLKAPEKTTAKNIATTENDMDYKEMLKKPMFYMLWIIFTFGCVSGLLIIGHASPIGQERIGLTPQVASFAVSFIGLSNTFGRLFWGSVSDKMGRYKTLSIMLGFSGVMMMLLYFASGFVPFVISICGIALSFGGFLGIFPSITSDLFGSKNLGNNYGIMLTAYGVAAFVGPRLAATAKEISGGYDHAFIIATILNVIGIVFAIVIAKKVSSKSSSAISKVA